MAAELVTVVDPKSLFASKINWWSMLAMAVQTIPSIAEHIPQPWGAIMTGVVTMVLRSFTSQPVTLAATAKSLGLKSNG